MLCFDTADVNAMPYKDKIKYLHLQSIHIAFTYAVSKHIIINVNHLKLWLLFHYPQLMVARSRLGLAAAYTLA